MTLGLVPHDASMVLIAALESTIGLLLLSGRRLRLALALLVVQLVGILSPIVLLPGEMFRTDPIAPTLAGQYVLKDIILGAAALVVAGKALGADMVMTNAPEHTRTFEANPSRRSTRGVRTCRRPRGGTACAPGLG